MTQTENNKIAQIKDLSEYKCKGLPKATAEIARKSCQFFNESCLDTKNKEKLEAMDSPNDKVCKMAWSLCSADKALMQESSRLAAKMNSKKKLLKPSLTRA